MQTRGVVGVSLALVLFAGCTGAPQTTAPPDLTSPSASAVTDLVDGDHLRPEAVEALRTWFAALPPAAQEQEVAALDVAIERQLWTLSGLEMKVGGAQRADELFSETNTAIRATLAKASGALTLPVKIGRKGLVLPADSLSEADGAALFGGMLLSGATAIGAAGWVDGKTVGKETDKSGITRTVTKDSATVEFHAKTVRDGVEVTIETTTTAKPCPDASGRAVVKAAVSGSTHQGQTGTRYGYQVDVTLQVGDDAEVISKAVDVRSEKSEYSATGRRYIDLAFGHDGTSTFKRSVGDITQDFANATAREGVLVQGILTNMAIRGARDQWLSGACVSLKPTVSAGPRGLTPGSTVEIVAAPRATIDGAPTGGTVTAQLTEGQSSVAPAGKVPADATFSYVAPSAPDKSGKVALESRSRRGVGKATIDFDTSGSSFIGTADQFNGSGKICDLRKPFVIAGGGYNFAFKPDSETGGDFTITGKAGREPFIGESTYTIKLDANGNPDKIFASRVNKIRARGRLYPGTAATTFTLRATAPCDS